LSSNGIRLGAWLGIDSHTMRFDSIFQGCYLERRLK
jgi:hypothetical protein